MELTRADIERISKLPVNFVVGKERSGTTLLQVMLNAHSNIVAPPESRFIILLYPRYGAIRQWTEHNIRDFCKDLFRERLFRNRWGMDEQKLISTLLPVKESLSFLLLCKTIYFLYAPKGKEVKMIFDKNPVYYHFLPQLEELFPKAKFIHIVRDYRDNITSYNRVFQKKKAADLAYRWVEINKLIEESKLRKQDDYFTIKYELLVTETENSIKGICNFLGLPYNVDMAKDHISNLHPHVNQIKAKRFVEVHGSLLQPINTSHIDEWKKKLSPDEVAAAEAVAGEYGEKQYGYKLTIAGQISGSSGLGIIKLKFWGVKQLYNIILNRLGLYYFVKKNIWPDF